MNDDDDIDFNELKKCFYEDETFLGLTIDQLSELRGELMFSFMPWQKKFINLCLTSRRVLFPKSRQIGGTHTVSFACFLLICLSPMKGDFFYQSKKESTAKDFIRSIKMWMELSNVAAQCNAISLDGVMSLEIKFENGCRLIILSSNPSAVISITPLAIFLDEFAVNKNCEELYGLVVPAVEWKGRLIILSTVRDKQNYFSKIIEEAENGNPKRWDYMKVTLIDAVSEGLVERMNMVKIMQGCPEDTETNEEFIERKKAECPSVAKFEQEYMVKPSEKEDFGTPFSDLLCNPIVRSWKQLDEKRRNCPVKINYYIGYDVGRAEDGDEACLDLSADIGGVLVPVKNVCNRGMKFDDQKELIRSYIENYRPVKVCIDASSLGWNIAESLEGDFPNLIMQIKMNTASKITGLVSALIKSMKDHSILIDDEHETRDSLSTIRETVDDKGNTSYWVYRVRGKDQRHGDKAIAKCLVNHAWIVGRGEKPTVSAEEMLDNMPDFDGFNMFDDKGV